MKFSIICKLKTLFYNFLFFTFFLFLFELFLGNYFSKQKPVSEIPSLYYGKDFSWKLNGLYERKNKRGELIRYKRDIDGYRSFSRDENKKVILTIGGSTTDQTFISEMETWQDVLDIYYSDYDFINGGVDGLSSYGHFFSMKRWYPETLKEFEVSKIIFYIGLNDLRFLIDGFNNNDFFTDSRKSKIIRYFRARSFILNKGFLIIRSWKSRNYLNSQNNIGEYVSDIVGHSKRSEEFNNSKKTVKFTFSNSPYASTFRNLVKDLLVLTNKNFPKSQIIIIQQQLPGCKFIDNLNVINRHPVNNPIWDYLYGNNIDICVLFGQTQLEINEAAKSLSFPESKIKVLPMYLEEILDGSSVYDYVHTNPIGSKKIADYIYQNIDL